MRPPHPLTNFEIERYFKDEPMFNGVYSRNSLPVAKVGGYVVNLDERGSSGTHWVAIHVHGPKATYFDSFGIEHIPDEVLKFLKGKDLEANIFRVQSKKSVLCGYFCIKFLEYMFHGKTLTDFTRLFSPTDFNKNDKTVLKLFGIEQ